MFGDHASVLGSMSVYQIFRNCQCLNDSRVLIYDSDTLTTWLWNCSHSDMKSFAFQKDTFTGNNIASSITI